LLEKEMEEGRSEGGWTDGPLGKNTKLPALKKVFGVVEAMKDHGAEELSPPAPVVVKEGEEEEGEEVVQEEDTKKGRKLRGRKGRKGRKGKKGEGQVVEMQCWEEEEDEDVTWLGHPLPVPSSLPSLTPPSLPSSSSSSYLARLPKLVTRMTTVLQRRVYAPDACRQGGGIKLWVESEAVAHAVFARMRALQQQEQGAGAAAGKGGGKTKGGASKSAKQKAVLDLLQELRRQGCATGTSLAARLLRDPIALAHAPTPFVLEGLLLPPSLPPSHLLSPPKLHTGWSKAETYYTRGLVELTGLRADLLNRPPHRDVPPTQAQMMLRLAEGLTTMAAQQRALLSEVVSGVGELSDAVSWMERVGGEGGREGGRVLPAQGVLRRGLMRQAALIEAAGEGLGQVHVLVATVAGARKDESSSSPSSSSSFSASVALLPSLLSSWERRLQTLAAAQRQALTNPILTHHEEGLKEGGVRLAAEAAAALSSSQVALAVLAPPQVLGPVLTALAAVGVREGGREGGRTRTGGRRGVKAAMEGVVKACLLSVQGLAAHRPSSSLKKEEESESEEEEGREGGKEEEEATLLGALTQGVAEAKGLKLGLLHTRVQALHAVLLPSLDDLDEEGGRDGGEEELDGPTLWYVHRLLSLVLAGAGRVVGELIMGNKGTCKLSYICLRLFRTLLSQGLCGDGKEGEGEG